MILDCLCSQPSFLTVARACASCSGGTVFSASGLSAITSAISYSSSLPNGLDVSSDTAAPIATSLVSKPVAVPVTETAGAPMTIKAWAPSGFSRDPTYGVEATGGVNTSPGWYHRCRSAFAPLRDRMSILACRRSAVRELSRLSCQKASAASSTSEHPGVYRAMAVRIVTLLQPATDSFQNRFASRRLVYYWPDHLNAISKIGDWSGLATLYLLQTGAEDKAMNPAGLTKAI